MGTQIQANAFLREYYPTIDLEKQIPENDLNRGLFKLYDLEEVRQTILEHESIFRQQLQELHRLYRRQQELMNEMKRRGINKVNLNVEKCRSSCLFSPSPCDDAKKPWSPHHSSMYPMAVKSSLRSCAPRILNCNLGFPADVYSRDMEKKNHKETNSLTFDLDHKGNNNPGHISANPCSSFNLVTKDFFRNSLYKANGENSTSILGPRNEKSGKGLLYDEYDEKMRFLNHSSIGDFCSHQPFPQSLSAEPRKHFSTCPLYSGASVSQKRKKIFGVEISEESDDPFDMASNKSSKFDWKGEPHKENHCVFAPWVANSLAQNLDLRGPHLSDGRNGRLKEDLKGEISIQERISKHADCPSNQENPRGGLPWFLRNSQVGGDLNKRKMNPYLMDLNSLQSRPHKIFEKGEMHDCTVWTSKQNEVISATIAAQENLSNIETNRGFGNNVSNLRHCIDLNLSLDEEDVMLAPSLPNAIVKVIDAPAVMESETDAPLKEVESKKMNGLPYEEERDKIAAEAMIAMSSFTEEELVDDDDCSLKWFAGIISLQCGNSSTAVIEVPMNWSRGHDEEEESVPSGMDYFEFMTLKLEDTGGKHHTYKQFSWNDPNDDEAGATWSKRSQRGRSRRGRQRKDFQRDVLPGLITLSRLEVKEDFQAFEELLKSEGGSSSWISTRNGRGRKRAITPPEVETLCSTQAEQPICRLDERSLTGWGKRTRRLPRQRCPNALLSFPVKC